MPVVTPSLSTPGILGAFHQRMDQIPTVYDKHSLRVPSTTQTETYGMLGFVPEPREFLNGRQFQGMLDFTFNVENNEYELSMIVPRRWIEDDQIGAIRQRFSELAEVWATFKDSLFATLLANGNVAGNTGWDGVVFHGDSRTIGSSGTIDNNLAQAAAASDDRLVVAEAINLIAESRAKFLGYKDDTGRPFNTAAVNNLRAIVPPHQEAAFYNAINQTMTGGGDSNVFAPAFLQGVDVLPYLSSPTEVFMSALGATRKPFIYQERTALEIVILESEAELARNGGAVVLCRQRFILTYGDPRHSQLFTIT